MKPNNFRGGKFFFVLGMQLFLALRLATADQNDGLDSLSDSELYLHPNQEIARPLLESRMDRYTPAERANFKDELLLEIERRKKGSLPATASELLDRLRDGQIDANAAGISISLQALLEESSDSERNQIRDRFISDWELLTLPDASDRSPESERKRFLFEVYLQKASSLFSSESELLPVLEQRCMNREIEGEVALLLKGLCSPHYKPGAITSAKIEALFSELDTWGVAELGLEERSTMLPIMYTILGYCGEDGLEALKRMKKTSTELGAMALGIIGTPEAEDLLWATYHESEDPFGTIRIKVLSALIGIQAQQPSTGRSDLIYNGLSGFLEIPEQTYALATMDKAVQLIKESGDSRYLAQLEALEHKLEKDNLNGSLEYKNRPDNAEKWRANVLRNIGSAHEVLSER
jgi:hypothetical protein